MQTIADDETPSRIDARDAIHAKDVLAVFELAVDSEMVTIRIERDVEIVLQLGQMVPPDARNARRNGSSHPLAQWTLVPIINRPQGKT